MTVLLDSVSADAESSAVDAVGPILVSVIGSMKTGHVRITADIGSGEVTAFTYSKGDPIAIARLEFATGVSFKAYLENTNDDETNVTVEYINV
jgi:hypothetical protein